MTSALFGFVRALRNAGVRVSPAETIDLFQAVELVGFDDRLATRESAVLVLAKSRVDAARVELVFDRYFGGDSAAFDLPADEGIAPAQPFDADEFADDLLDATLARILLEDDRARLVRDLYAAARAERLDDVRYPTQINTAARRILERLGLVALDAAIARLRARGDARRTQAADFLEGRRSAVGQLARDLVERRFAASSGGGAGVRRDEFLRDARFANLDRRDVERMRTLVREAARRLATRFGRTRKRALRGRLDARATTRRAHATGGVPFDLRWKTRTLAKPRLLLLCDVSGSVAALASIFLLFIQELHDAVADVRAFAFSGRAIDIGAVLARRSIEHLGAHVMREIGYQSSDYGRALGDVEASGALSGVDRKTTVVILGDGRTNYGEPRIDVVRTLFERAKRVIWLNPEDRGAWGTDDSEMLRYARYCTLARTCNRLRDLEDVVERLLEERTRDGASA